MINNLYDFGITYPDFFEEVMVLIGKYEDWPYSGISLKYRDLFRLLSEREREPSISTKSYMQEYENMKTDAYLLKVKDPEAFDKFALLIRKYVVREENSIGYTTFVKCLYNANKIICSKAKNIVNNILKSFSENGVKMNIEKLESLSDQLIRTKSEI